MAEELYHGFKRADWDKAKTVADAISDRVCTQGACHGIQIDARGHKQPFSPMITVICFLGTKDQIKLEGIDTMGFEVKIEERPTEHAL